MRDPLQTESGEIFRRLTQEGLPAAGYPLRAEADVWEAIRAFFKQQSET
jgi:hypothetical protein